MTDFERHATRLFGDMYEVASLLGAHGFRVETIGDSRYELADMITGECAAVVSRHEAAELAAWLELQPLE